MQTVGNIIDRRLTLPRVRFAAIGVIGVAMLLLAFSFATSTNNRTCSGLGLGSDYLAFHNAGTILNKYPASRLYDLDLQSKLYHANLPGESADVSLPFANAPFIAVAMRPLAALPYAWSYAAWCGVSIALFAGAFTLAWKASGLPKQFFAAGLLVALSFEPFIIENLHGGQISTIGMLAICATIYLAQSSRPFRAGCCLALCIYKPTLLPIILPMLVLTKQWKLLAGFFTGAIALIALSLATVGQAACLDYVHMLTGYAGKTATGAGGFQMTKFIDLNSFMKLLGVSSMMIWTVLLVAGAAMANTVWSAKPTSGRIAWACAIAATLVLNLYVGIYDAILIVPAILLVCGKLLNGSRSFNTLSIEFRMLLCAIWILPWISGLFARETGVQLFTFALIAFAIYTLRMMLGRRSETLSLTALLPLSHNAVA